MRPADPLIIAGAGIAGLTAALALGRAGWPVLVLERAHALEEVGAGIQLSPNASRVLVDLGLARELSALAIAPEASDIRRGRDGALLASIPLGEAIQARYGASWLVIHRADLQALLVAAVRRQALVQIELGAAITGFSTRGDGVDVTVIGADGVSRTFGGAGLIGADGVWSTVRRLLGDRRPAIDSGRMAWRAVLDAGSVPQPFLGLRSGLWLGPQAHLVHYPVKGGAKVNVVAVTSGTLADETWSATGHPGVIDYAFSGWADAPRALIAGVPGWQVWPLSTRRAWLGPGRGAVTLMGDAAHPTLPFLAQGGAAAIEDAVVLAGALINASDVVAGMRTYEEARRDRVTRLMAAAQRNGTVYHLSGLAAHARDLVIRMTAGPGLIDRYDWVYRWRA